MAYLNAMLPPSAQEMILQCLSMRALGLEWREQLSLSSTCRRICRASPRPSKRCLFETLLPRLAKRRKCSEREYVLAHCGFAQRVEYLCCRSRPERIWARRYPHAATRIWACG